MAFHWLHRGFSSLWSCDRQLFGTSWRSAQAGALRCVALRYVSPSLSVYSHSGHLIQRKRRSLSFVECSLCMYTRRRDCSANLFFDGRAAARNPARCRFSVTTVTICIFHTIFTPTHSFSVFISKSSS